MFGLSFSEVIVIGIVALVAVGPEKLPGMLRTLGEWIRKLRNLSNEMRAQTGIDEILRAEGLQGGVSELKSLIRSLQRPIVIPDIISPAPPPRPEPRPEPPAPVPAQGLVETGHSTGSRHEDPYANLDVDATREYPPEGPDAYGALPDDLVDDGLEEPAGEDVLSAAAAVLAEAPPEGESAGVAPEAPSGAVTSPDPAAPTSATEPSPAAQAISADDGAAEPPVRPHSDSEPIRATGSS